MYIQDKFNTLFQPVAAAMENAELAFAEACRRQADEMARHIAFKLHIPAKSVEADIGGRSMGVALGIKGGKNTGPGITIRPAVSFNVHYQVDEVSDRQLEKLNEYVQSIFPVGFRNLKVESKDGMAYATFSLNEDILSASC